MQSSKRRISCTLRLNEQESYMAHYGAMAHMDSGEVLKRDAFHSKKKIHVLKKPTEKKDRFVRLWKENNYIFLTNRKKCMFSTNRRKMNT